MTKTIGALALVTFGSGCAGTLPEPGLAKTTHVAADLELPPSDPPSESHAAPHSHVAEIVGGTILGAVVIAGLAGIVYGLSTVKSAGMSGFGNLGNLNFNGD